MLRWLFYSGSDFNLINSNGHSALHKAAQRGSSAACKWLVHTFLFGNLNANGFLFIGPDSEGACPSDLCGMEGHESLAKWISQHECGYISRLCHKAYFNKSSPEPGLKSSLFDNQCVPLWLEKDLHVLKSNTPNSHGMIKQWGANCGIRRMAINLLEIRSSRCLIPKESGANSVNNFNDID